MDDQPGSIRKRPDGRWSAVDEQGATVRGTVGRSRAEAVGKTSETVLRALVRRLREEATVDRPGCLCSERFGLLADAAEHRLATGWTEGELDRHAESDRIRTMLDADEPSRS